MTLTEKLEHKEAPKLEVKAYAEETTLHNLDAGTVRKAVVIRVQYRRPPTRRWTKFFIVPNEQQTIEEVLEQAPKTAEWHEKERS